MNACAPKFCFSNSNDKKKKKELFDYCFLEKFFVLPNKKVVKTRVVEEKVFFLFSTFGKREVVFFCSQCYEKCMFSDKNCSPYFLPKNT